MLLENLSLEKSLGLDTRASIYSIIDKAHLQQQLDHNELTFLINNCTNEELQYLKARALEVRLENYQDKVYLRGLIEISNICTQACNYCGIRCANSDVHRYRLTKEQILECVQTGIDLNYHTFVLQGGEDPFFTDQVLGDIIKSIKTLYPDVAITLSIGERSYESYLNLYNAGADRYLLRHETASKELYNKLHPDTMSFENRLSCLQSLKDIGFQVGCGFMVNSPYQTNDHLVKDFEFLQSFRPHMCGIGPYINHPETPFAGYPDGNLRQMEFCISLTRLLLPYLLLPATTALATISPKGRERILSSGANVIMPNLSPVDNRINYEIYKGKVATGDEAAQSHNTIVKKIKDAGFTVDMQIGHVKGWNNVYK